MGERAKARAEEMIENNECEEDEEVVKTDSIKNVLERFEIHITEREKVQTEVMDNNKCDDEKEVFKPNFMKYLDNATELKMDEAGHETSLLQGLPICCKIESISLLSI